MSENGNTRNSKGNLSSGDDSVLDSLIIGKRPDFSRRVLFLDFDGPVNLGKDYIPPAGEERELVEKWFRMPENELLGTSFGVSSIHISFYKEVADLLRPLNCLWITSWKGLTQSKLNSMLGFDFGYLDWKYRGFSDYGTYGKLNGMGKLIREMGCDWLVVDDNMDDDAKKWLERDSGRSGELVVPDSYIGMSVEEMAEIERIMEL